MGKEKEYIPLDDVIRGIEENKPQPPKHTDESGEGNSHDEIHPGTHPVYKTHEREP